MHNLAMVSLAMGNYDKAIDCLQHYLVFLSDNIVLLAGSGVFP